MSKGFNIVSIEINGVTVDLIGVMTGKLTTENEPIDTYPIKITGEYFQLASNTIPVEMLPPQNDPRWS